MTQYLDAVLNGKERLSEEELDKTVTSLYLHKSAEDNYFHNYLC